MAMIRALLISLFFAAAPPIAAAQTAAGADAQENLDLARRYVTIGGGEQTFTDAAYYGFKAALDGAGIHANDNQWLRIRDVVRREMAPAAAVFTNELVAFYASHNTRADFQAALDYYSSEPGQRYVAASIAAVLPVMLHLQSGGRAPLPEPPLAGDLEPARLDSARNLSAAIGTRFSPLEAAQMDLAGFGVDRFSDFLARSLASTLSVADLDAARVWVLSEAAERLEGSNPERNEAIQLATLHASAAANLNALREQVSAILREQPA